MDEDEEDTDPLEYDEEDEEDSDLLESDDDEEDNDPLEYEDDDDEEEQDSDDEDSDTLEYDDSDDEEQEEENEDIDDEDSDPLEYDDEDEEESYNSEEDEDADPLEADDEEDDDDWEDEYSGSSSNDSYTSYSSNYINDLFGGKKDINNPGISSTENKESEHERVYGEPKKSGRSTEINKILDDGTARGKEAQKTLNSILKVTGLGEKFLKGKGKKK